MHTIVKDLKDTLQDNARVPEGWRVKTVLNEDNLTYVAMNDTSKEAIVVDPMREDFETLLQIARGLTGYRFVAVIDTHTHADHVSCAPALAERLSAPLIQHQVSPSKRIHLRVSRDTAFPTAAGPLHLYLTPGHTPDSITPVWGPFIFAGDTLLYGDAGRDDLPGGDPAAHHESLEKLKDLVKPDMIFLPGHDDEARASSWATQLKISPPLSQDRETYIRENGSWVGPSPKLLKESLFENFK